MNAANLALLDILRCELNATNQQFAHILALREWDRKEAAARIVEVDDIDFANAMRIIDHLVKSGVSISLAGAEFNPGTDYAAILRAEQAMEARLVAALDRSDAIESSAGHLVDTASRPRAAYARWLADNIAKTGATRNDKRAETKALEGLVGWLITMIEQSMIHAFVEWHGDNRPAADAAWATSGAAMMQLTRLVRLFARLPSVPCGGACPVANICHQAGETPNADRELALCCGLQADDAAQRCDQPAITKYCSSIADYYRQLSAWKPPATHPAASSNPPVFHSFAATLAKFVS
jgi:bacterioferritin (cytochrome b1)